MRDDPWPDAAIAVELVNALAALGAYDHTPTDPPF